MEPGSFVPMPGRLPFGELSAEGSGRAQGTTLLYVAGVKIGRAALWGFFLLFARRKTFLRKKLKKVLTNHSKRVIIIIVNEREVIK